MFAWGIKGCLTLIVCHIIKTMLSDLLQTNSPKETFSQLMDWGAAAHAAGDPVKALTAFESALALCPQDSHAVSACAALLFELSRPGAALTLLRSIESQLLLDADGCANLGLAALGCNQPQEATSYFQQALKLQPSHAAALTHLGMLAAREQRWLDAIAYARQCVKCTPNDETAYTNLIDFLLGARSAAEALEQLRAVPAQLKDQPQIAIRQVIALALNAEFDAANLAVTQLSVQALNELTRFLQRGGATDLQSLFYRQAIDAIQVCDWRDYARLLAVIGENNLHQGLQASPTIAAADKTTTLPPFNASRSQAKPANKTRVGIAATSLRDAAATEALAAELSLYDSTRFIFHIYSPTPQPQAVLAAQLVPHEVVEIAHFTDEEAVWRIRLDRLDIWFDLTCNTAWHRPDIAQYRVAPVQVQALPSRLQTPPGAYDYTLSDSRLLSVSISDPNQTAMARLPHTCWFTPYAAAPIAAPVTRIAAGLPADAFVICVFGPCAHITPKTFALWMQLLKDLPHAVLWLSPCSPNGQNNLLREAMQAGIESERLVFATAQAGMDAPKSLLPAADLFLAMPESSHAQSLADALRAGLPCLAAASPITNGVMHAAGLGDCVFESADAYISQARHLAQNPYELKALRERMRLSVAQSPLFDVASRATERALAWTYMVERSRAGLPPANFHIADFKLS